MLSGEPQACQKVVCDHAFLALQVAQQLPNLTLKQVRDTVAFLMDNANIYTVSDEHHYKSTKCD